MLFFYSAFLLDLSNCEGFTNCTSTRTESKLGFWQIFLSDVGDQAVEDDPAKIFSAIDRREIPQ